MAATAMAAARIVRGRDSLITGSCLSVGLRAPQTPTVRQLRRGFRRSAGFAGCEQVIELLEAAFAQDWLTGDEMDAGRHGVDRGPVRSGRGQRRCLRRLIAALSLRKPPTRRPKHHGSSRIHYDDHANGRLMDAPAAGGGTG